MPSSPLPQLVPTRVRTALPRVQQLIWGRRRSVPVQVTDTTIGHLRIDEIGEAKLRVAEPGEYWGKLWDQRWYRVDLSGMEPGDYLEWGDQAEATLYMQGVPHFGLDPGHLRAPLGSKVVDVAWVEAYCSRTMGGGLTAQGSRFDGAWLVRRDEDAWQAWIDLTCLWELATSLRDDRAQTVGTGLDTARYLAPIDMAPPLYRQVLRYLDCALDAFDTNGLPALREALATALADLQEKSARLTGALIGNSHLDLVYLWPEKVGEAKAVHTFSTANRLMHLYPEFRFTWSQPASYEAVERRSPSLAREVKARMGEGRWEATGAMYVESDLLMACGEGLARSLSYGQEGFRELRGEVSRLLWLPDCFGFPNCMPQLMQLAGVEYFITTKLTWNAVTRIPYSSFVWSGNDGSSVVAHFPRSTTYANVVDAPMILGAASAHVQADVHREFAHLVGYGDGGGRPTEEMCERARRFASLAGVPPMKWDTIEGFFDRLAPLRADLPVWQGEFYLEYHRGVCTTLGEVKAAFRALERGLQLREAVAVAGRAGRSEEIDADWRRMIFHQFHDDITGTSVPEVYVETLAELRELARSQSERSAALLSGLSGGEQACVFNPLPMPWSGWVREAPGSVAKYLEIAPLSGVPAGEGRAPAGAAVATSTTLGNGIVSAAIHPDGTLASLAISGRKLALKSATAIPVIYPDIPANYDAWEIDRHTLGLGTPLETPAAIAVEEIGGHRAVLAATRQIGAKSRIVIRYILEEHAEVLRIEIELDWQEERKLLKLHFPTDYSGRMARFASPFGSTLRNQQPGLPEAEAQWEVPASRWAAVSYDGERDGLLLVAEDKYGFSARGGELTVSLVRSAIHTGFQTHGPLTPRALARHESDSTFTDLGLHHISLAIGRHDLGAPAPSQAAVLAETLFAEVAPYRGAPVVGPLGAIEDAPTLVPSWSLPAARGEWILRLHETMGQAGTAFLPFRDAVEVTPVDLLGRELGPPLKGGLLAYRPYQIVSLRITPR